MSNAGVQLTRDSQRNNEVNTPRTNGSRGFLFLELYDNKNNTIRINIFYLYLQWQAIPLPLIFIKMKKQISKLQAKKPDVKKPETGSDKGGHTSSPIGTKIKRAIGLFIFYLVEYAEGTRKSGRAGGTVLMRNGQVRAIGNTPTHLTPAAGAAKGRFGFWQNSFGTLSQANQQAWNNTVFTTSDRLSRTKSLKGRPAYAQANINLELTGQTALTVPAKPPRPAQPILDGVITADDSAHSISLAYQPNTDDGIVLVSATLPLGSNIFKPKANQFKNIGIFDGTVASPVDLTTDYEAVFGTRAIAGVGNKVFLRLTTIADSGNASPVVEYTTIIVA